MNKTILERYPVLPDGRYLIDIHAGKINDLYDDFDRYTPYARKELDQDLAEYIIDSASELAGADFGIQFHFVETADESLQDRIKKSISSYFQYLRSREFTKLARMLRKSMVLLFIGIAVLFISVWVNSGITDESTVVHKVVAEGTTVVAWVSMWEALANFLINWTPISRKMKLYKRIADSQVMFM